MASVPQQMQPNMVFATTPQMATGPQGQLLLATGQPMAQQMNGQIGQYIQTGYPTTGFVTQAPNQYIPMNYVTNPVMMNPQFQTANPVQNLAIQIPNGNGQQLIATTTPTQMTQAQQQGGKNSHSQKGHQQQNQQGGMNKTPVTANKSIHSSGQVAQNQQQQTLIQQAGQTYFVTGGQTYVQAAPQQNQNKKSNNNKSSNKNSAQKPIQIQSQMMPQTFKTGGGMQQANIQATPIQFANSNGQQLMFSPMQTAQTIWSPPVQQGQFMTAQPQQVLLRSPQGEQATMVLQQPGQQQFQTMPVQIAQTQSGQQSQQNTGTMQVNQQPVIQMSNGTYAQVTSAAPSTPTKSTIIQPKIEQNVQPKTTLKPPVKLAPNTTAIKSEGSPVKLAPKLISSSTASTNSSANAQTSSVNQKSIGTNPPRASFGMSTHTTSNGPAKQSMRSSQTNTTPSTRTVNTQVSKKIGASVPEKRSQGTDSPALTNNKKEETKPKSDIITHLIDGHLVLESCKPFPCDEVVETSKKTAKSKDLKGEQKENISQTQNNNNNNNTKSKTDVQKNVPEAKSVKFPDSKVKSMQNGVKFSPIASKPIAQNGLPVNKTPASVSKSVSIGTAPIAGLKRSISKATDYKPPEKKAAIQPVEESPVNGKSESKENISNLWMPSSDTNPKEWTIQEVCDFVSHIDGCAQFAEEFRSQEIDGQALMLIKEKHIVEILNTKWGMALKIYRKIEELKTAFHIS